MNARSPRRPPSPSPRNIAAAGVITAVLLGYIAPVHDLLDQRSQLNEAQHQLEAAKATRRSLQAQLHASRRADVLERRARAQGAVRPGERAFTVEGAGPDDGIDAALPGAGG